MALYPAAEKRIIPPGPHDPTVTVRGVVLHIAVSDAPSLYDWFNGPSGGVESHFYVRRDGTVEQYRDTAYEADAQYAGNSFVLNGIRYGYISVETQGGMGADANAGTWSPAQLAGIKALIEWAHDAHGVPYQRTATPTSPGIGWHSLFPEWTQGSGKTCPGTARIAQIKSELEPWYLTKGQAMPAKTTWRGVTLDPRSAAMMTEVAVLTGAGKPLATPTIRPIQGSYSTSITDSKGTHSGPGAIDLSVRGFTDDQIDHLIEAMRRVGWAAWYRPPNWDGRGGGRHVHAIAVGCTGLPGAAVKQVLDYRAGLNGLANRAPDNGPRLWVGVTWESYLAAAKRPTPKPSPTPTSPAAAPGVTEALMAGRIPGGTGAWHSITMPPDGRRHRLAVSYSGPGPRKIKLQPHREVNGAASNVGPEIALTLAAGVRAYRDLDATVEQVSLWWDGAAGQSIDPQVVAL